MQPETLTECLRRFRSHRSRDYSFPSKGRAHGAKGTADPSHAVVTYENFRAEKYRFSLTADIGSSLNYSDCDCLNENAAKPSL